MILGAIADDFTGAGDLAGILVEGGLRTTLLTRVADPIPSDGDAVVIALKTRSVPVGDAVAQSLAALARLRELGCRQIVFKYCSTFDSTRTGNIGPVAEALADALDARGVVVCPAFPANGRTVYQGTLFVGDRPLSESGMRDHPLTPMTDSDIRRWLGHQTTRPVGHLEHATVRAGPRAIRYALARHDGLVVVDAIEDSDLLAIGAAVADAPLVTGGSAVAMGLPENYRRAGLIDNHVIPTQRRSGPAVVLAGSCSTATRGQVARYRNAHPAFEVDAARLLAGDPVLEEADAFLADHRNEAPLAHSSPVEATDAAPTVAGRMEALFAELATRAVARGVTRLVVAGGETSGAVVNRLNLGPLEVGRLIAPGVPLLAGGGIGLALKSGNFGDGDFLDTAVRALGGNA